MGEEGIPLSIAIVISASILGAVFLVAAVVMAVFLA